MVQRCFSWLRAFLCASETKSGVTEPSVFFSAPSDSGSNCEWETLVATNSEISGPMVGTHCLVVDLHPQHVGVLPVSMFCQGQINGKGESQPLQRALQVHATNLPALNKGLSLK